MEYFVIEQEHHRSTITTTKINNKNLSVPFTAACKRSENVDFWNFLLIGSAVSSPDSPKNGTISNTRSRPSLSCYAFFRAENQEVRLFEKHRLRESNSQCFFEGSPYQFVRELSCFTWYILENLFLNYPLKDYLPNLWGCWVGTITWKMCCCTRLSGKRPKLRIFQPDITQSIIIMQNLWNLYFL